MNDRFHALNGFCRAEVLFHGLEDSEGDAVENLKALKNKAVHDPENGGQREMADEDGVKEFIPDFSPGVNVRNQGHGMGVELREVCLDHVHKDIVKEARVPVIHGGVSPNFGLLGRSKDDDPFEHPECLGWGGEEKKEGAEGREHRGVLELLVIKGQDAHYRLHHPEASLREWEPVVNQASKERDLALGRWRFRPKSPPQGDIIVVLIRYGTKEGKRERERAVGEGGDGARALWGIGGREAITLH